MEAKLTCTCISINSSRRVTEPEVVEAHSCKPWVTNLLIVPLIHVHVPGLFSGDSLLPLEKSVPSRPCWQKLSKRGGLNKVKRKENFLRNLNIMNVYNKNVFSTKILRFTIHLKALVRKAETLCYSL